VQRVRAAGVLLFFGAIAVVMTHPLAGRMTSALAENLGDPLLNSWIIGWGSQRLLDGLRGFWQAPIFFPYPDTLAYSEHLLGVTIFVAPIYWATGNAVLAHNVALILSYVLAAGGMFLLARALTGRSDAALVAALAFAFSPYRTGGQMARLQLLMSGWLPLTLLWLHRYLGTGRRRHLAGFAAAYAIGSLANTYFLFFFALPVGVIAVHGLWRVVSNRRRAAIDLAVAALVILAVLAPVVYAYYDVQRTLGLERSVAENVEYSADLSSYFRAWWRAPISRWIGVEKVADRALYLGFTVMALAATALVAIGLGRFRPSDLSRARLEPTPSGLTRAQVAAIYATIVVVAALLSLGPQPQAWGLPLLPQGPYGALMSWVPGLNGLRAPSRFAVVVSMGLAVLAALATTIVFDRRSARASTVFVAIVGAAVLAEGWRVPVRLWDFSPEGESARRQAYAHVERYARGAVLELPIAIYSYPRVPVANATPQMVYQYATLWHGRPIVNGVSGFTSPLVDLFQGNASPFLFELPTAATPNPSYSLLAGIEGVRRLGVRCVVIHVEDYADHDVGRRAAEQIRSVPGLVTAVSQFGGTIVLLLSESTAAPVSFDGNPRQIVPLALSAASDDPAGLLLATDDHLTTRWGSGQLQQGSEWVEVRFDRTRDVAGLRMSMGSFREDYPRRLIVESHADGRPPSVLFDGSVVPELIGAIVRDSRVVQIDLALPANRSERLILRQAGASDHRQWSIPELALWER
jgi:hypothetical protein